MYIASKANTKYKHLVQLTYARGRKQEKQFLIEGHRELTRALQAQVIIQTFIFSQTAFDHEQRTHDFNLYLTKENCLILADALFATLSKREHPDGILGLASTWETPLSALKINPHGLYLLVEKLEKPGNLGALMRSAEATAVDGFIVADPEVDLFNPHVIRTSQGAVFNLMMVKDSAVNIFNFLNPSALQMFAATPNAKMLYWQADMKKGCVICIGNEAQGLTPLWLNQTTKIAIPMFGHSADSLNAGVAGTLCLYEARRQRY